MKNSKTVIVQSKIIKQKGFKTNFTFSFLIFLFFFLGNSSTISQPFTPYTVDDNFYGAWSVWADDIDGDGDTDIAGTAIYGNEVSWWENDGDEGFTKHIIDSDFQGAYFVQISDLDSDGDQDLLGAAYYASDVVWWENNGDEVFTKHLIHGNFAGASMVFAFDIDQDNDIDLLGSAFDAGDIAWWENDGNENFTFHMVDPNLLGALSVEANDIDGDGLIDIIATGYTDSDLVWYQNMGGGNFSKIIIDQNLVGAASASAVDMELDGDYDIIAAGNAYGQLFWWENDGSEVFTKHLIGDGFGGAFAPYAVDLDKDGDKDVIAAAQYANTVAWWENDGFQNFDYHLITDNLPYVSGLYVTDIDGDSNLDFVATAFSSDEVAWWKNGVDNDGDGFTVNDGDCDDFDETIYPGAMEYCDGVDNNCDGVIDETDLTLTSPSCVSVFYGYDMNSSCEEITVSISGGMPPYSIEWSHDPEIAVETALVCAEAPEDFMVTVVVTDALDCTKETNILVKVTDLRCSNNPNNVKILVCHIPPGKPNKQKTLCIGIDDVADHLSHGDNLGVCNMPDPCNSAQQQSSFQYEKEVLDWVEKPSFRLYPNPVDQVLFVQFNSPQVPNGILQITNYMGQSVVKIDIGDLQDNPTKLDISGLVNGFYTVSVKTQTGSTITKTFVVHH